MSNKPILIIIHGMGNHTDESFKSEVVNSANTALNRYKNYKNKTFEDFVDVRPITYNHIFEKVRQRFVDSNKSISEFLTGNDEIEASLSLIQKVTEMQEKLGSDSFVYTHVLDVLLYLTNVGEWIRTYVARKILEIKDTSDDSDIHILAHSQGTAVLHDSLSKLMRKDNPNNAPFLDPRIVKFKSIWMFSNVSRLMSSYSNQVHPYLSIVKPGDHGCTNYFFNIKHVLDPFAKPMMFNPQPTDKWINSYNYNNNYRDITTKVVSRKNTHSIEGYIEDPLVSVPFLQFLMDMKASKAKIIEGNNKFKSINGEREKLKENFKHIDTKSDLKDYLELLKDFKNYVETID